MGELLRAEGWEQAAVEARFPAMWTAYLGNLRRVVERTEVRALPGIPALLDRVEGGGPHVVLGLLTGNVAQGAAIKLRAAGIDPARFTVGAYGSDHADRPELPAVAVRRARELIGIDYRGKEVVIIGDTPFDVSCGHHLGVRTLAVATGMHSADDLRACDPDHVFADLSDTDAVWKAIAE
ncbi:MAG: hypothetical protein JWM27_4023 [Gemmatimonadetes bacterium]|nr:hypothetical protein [Gemmatimonadota bacterium]